MSEIWNKLFKKESGFTLIELLVVIGVLGILASIAIPRVVGVTEKARLSEAKTAISSIRSSLEMIYSDKNSYASADTGEYKTAADLFTETDIDEYLDNISDNWEYNIAAVSDNYLIEVIGSGGSYPNTLKASIKKGDSAVTSTTENNDPDANTLAE